MADESMWKKEISFKRKPKEPKAPKAPKEAKARKVPDAPGDEPTSVWKKDLSFKRKPKAKTEAEVETGPVEPESAPEPVQVPDAETSAKEALWKKEITRAAEEIKRAAESEASEPEAETPAPEPTPPAAPVAEVPVEESDPETASDQTVWKKEVSFSRKPKPTADVAAEAAAPAEDVAPEPVAAAEPVAAEPMAAEPVTDEPVAAAEEPVAEEPVAEEPVEEEPHIRTAEMPEDPAAARRASLVESWSARPKAPPVQVEPAPAQNVQDAPTAEIPAPTPEPPTVIHPPVPAAELPPLKAEKVPFWKKDISLGGKKKEPKQAKAQKEPKPPKQEKERRAKEPKASKIKADKGSKGAKKLVGLKIGASQLAAARVANNGSAELLQVAREPLDPGIVVGGELRDPDALAEALKDFFTKHKLPKKGVRLGIANNRIGVRTFEIAGIQDPKQLANAIRFRAQEVLPIPIDEAVLDYQILSEGTDEEGQPTRRVLLVVAYRELIDRYVDACKKAGVVLSGIDLEAFALLRALQAPQEGAGDDPTAALVAVAIGHERSTFAVSDGRTCEFTRVLEWGGAALNVAIARGLNAAPSEVEGVKHSLSLTNGAVPEGLTADQAKQAVDALRKAIQTFARELVSSLQYYQNQPGSLGIGEIVLSGGTAHLPGLAAELEGLIGVRVRVGDPLARMKVSKKVGDPDQIGSLAVAIGLGIED
jgi:type IV pilus assembly protein PilM